MTDPKRCEKPWGLYEVLHIEKGFQVKRIEVNTGHRLSLQRHAKRSEYWTVVRGEGLVTLDTGETRVGRGSVVGISIGQAHRIACTGKESLVFIEVQIGDYLGEDDIERLEDDYSRF